MNLNPKIYHDRIFYYESIIENPKEIINLIEKTDSKLTGKDLISPWIKWTASDDENNIFGYRKQTDIQKYNTSSEEVKLIYDTLKEALWTAGRDYTQKIGIEWIPPTALGISKYTLGGHMGKHVDDYRGESMQNGLLPIMSGVVYLNDDMEGGELAFANQDVLIKPKAGSIVLFPSVKPFYHESLPVTKGEKYMSAVFWIKQI